MLTRIKPNWISKGSNRFIYLQRCRLLKYYATERVTGSSTGTPFSPGPFVERKIVDRLKSAKPSETMSEEGDIDDAIDEESLKTMITFRDLNVANILEQKHIKEVLTIDENSTVFEAVKRMTENKVGGLVVVGKEMNPIGMITERDYLNKVILKGLSSKTTYVKQIMTPKEDLITVKMDTKVGECMHLMTHKRARHLPVVDDKGKLVGLISIGDIVKYILHEQKQTIEYLKDYVEGAY
jgi:CBS domain-containing protein